MIIAFSIIILSGIVFWGISLLLMLFHFRLLWRVLLHCAAGVLLLLFAASQIRSGFLFDNVDDFVLFGCPWPVYGLIIMIRSIRKIGQRKLEKLKVELDATDAKIPK